MKILIVDDDMMVAEALGDILETLGYQAAWVSRGEDALLKIGRESIDLVIMDLELPGMTGTELAAVIAARYPDLGILFVSGYSEQESRIERDSRSFRGFVRKPFEIADIKAAIEKTLS